MPQLIGKTTQATAQTAPSTWQVIKPFVIGGGILIVVSLLILWLILWIIKKIKLSQDVYHRIYRDRRRLCKVHSDSKRYIKWWKYHFNDMIKCVYQNSNKLHTKTIGHYMGHYYGAEGNLVIAFSNSRKWFILWPEIELLIVNKNPSIVYEVQKEEINEKGVKKIVTEQVKQDLPTNIENFADDCIYLNAYGIEREERTGFYTPVLRSKEGEVISMALPTFQSLKNVVLQNYMYEQTNQFVKVAKKSIDLNPNIRGIQKISDSSQSIETKEA